MAMQPLSSLDEIERLFAARGGEHYGEGVSQTEHALQCALLAEAEGAPASLIVAALLHDVGHLLEESDLAQDGIDDRHQVFGAEALAGLFGEAVRQPIALHVAAKRYLCCVEPAYFDTLSAASKHTLALQGGPFDAAQATAFEALPYWREAVALRRFDDLGKRVEPCGRRFGDFKSLMNQLLIE